MGRLYSFFLPDNGVDVILSLTIFFGLGIWLVVQRYKNIRDRAVLFYCQAPPEAKPQPDFSSNKIIDNPRIDSHERDPSLLPPAATRDRKYITSFDPATGIHLKTYMADNETDIATKIQTASAAAKTWARSTFPERKRVIKSLKRWLVENQDTCARVVCRDTGKTFLDAAFGEILVTCSKLDWILSHGERVLRPEARRSNLLLCYKYSEVHFEPLGVVSAIVSWNYPLHNSWSPIVASLFSGNAIVLKCSEQVIWSTLWFVGVIKECLRACQFDPELIQVVCCLPGQAEALTKSPLIKHITFIGSEEVGRKVAMAAAENLTPITLELGGKDPAIILPGTDLNQWSSIWMRGIYQNCGQNCIGIERLIVHSSQYAELYDMICRRAKELRFGPVLAPPVEGYMSVADCGSMISSERFGDLKRILDNAERDGADVDVGGKEYVHPYFPSGAYFSATVVGNPPPESTVAQRELFAPVALLQSYETVEEAIELANGTRYGLGASVFGPDQSYCIQVAKLLQCGMVSINDFGIFYVNQDLPFGGTKASGYGRFAGPEGLRSLTNPKAIISDRFPWLIQTSIPQVLDYPIRSMFQSWEFITGLIGFLYADGLRARGRWMVRLVKASRSNPTR